MMRSILVALLLGVFAVSCQKECEGDAPKPMSLNIRYENSSGNDAYNSGTLDADSLVAYYNFDEEKTVVSLKVAMSKEDTTLYFIDALPLLRKAYDLNVDTLFIGTKSTDIDTILFSLAKEESDCFSTVYHFEELRYNGVKLSGTDDFYIIEK